jgi:hypothetical protein
MTPASALAWVLIAAAAVFFVRAIFYAYWRAIGMYRLRAAGPRRIRASRHRLWRDPGAVGALSLVYGAGGSEHAPAPPFHFVEEHSAGSQPCVSVRDGRGRRWRVKWGHEARVEAFATRFAWACGYFAEVTHFVPAGVIGGVSTLTRARNCVELPGGHFVDARFELDDPDVRKLFDEHSWAWDDNPFVGSRELNGLKIVVMLLSNWDVKDRRDVARGSNTAIYEVRAGRWPRQHHEAQYLLADWGGAMGKWGTTVVTRGRWDADGFEAQTAQFVTGVADGRVGFGYAGQRTADIAGDIPVEHARWFYSYAGRMTEPQLVEGLLASGATQQEAARFARALVARIAQLALAHD